MTSPTADDTPPAYNAGGLLPGGPIRIDLHPHECVLEPERLRCVRSDHHHRPCQRAVDRARGGPDD